MSSEGRVSHWSIYSQPTVLSSRLSGSRKRPPSVYYLTTPPKIAIRQSQLLCPSNVWCVQIPQQIFYVSRGVVGQGPCTIRSPRRALGWILGREWFLDYLIIR